MPSASITTIPDKSVLQWDSSVRAWQATTVAAGFTASSIMAGGTKGQALTTNGLGTNTAWQGMTTQGDIEYYDGTKRARLAPSTSGYFLKTQGAAANPTWSLLNGVRFGGQNTTFTQAANDTLQTVYSTTITGNTLGTNGVIRVLVTGTMQTANSGTITVRYGGTIFATVSITGGNKFRVETEIANRAATNSQTSSSLYINLATVSLDVNTTGTIDTTADQTLLVTYQSDAGGSQNGTVQKVLVEILI